MFRSVERSCGNGCRGGLFPGRKSRRASSRRRHPGKHQRSRGPSGRASAGGVKSGPSLYFFTISMPHARNFGVKSMRSSVETPCRSNGAAALEMAVWGLSSRRERRTAAQAAPQWARSAHRFRDSRRTETPLCRLRKYLNLLPVPDHVEEHRRTRQILVPQAMMNRLIVPFSLTGLQVQSQQAFAKRSLPGRLTP